MCTDHAEFSVSFSVTPMYKWAMESRMCHSSELDHNLDIVATKLDRCYCNSFVSTLACHYLKYQSKN